MEGGAVGERQYNDASRNPLSVLAAARVVLDTAMFWQSLEATGDFNMSLDSSYYVVSRVCARV